MGFDFRWVDDPTDEERAEGNELAAEAKALMEKARDLGMTTNQYLGVEAVSPELEKLLEEHSLLDRRANTLRGTFHLNIWGMGIVRRAMYGLGMCFDAKPEDGPRPQWPQPSEFGFSGEEAEDALWEKDPKYIGWEPLTEAETAFFRARDAVLTWHGPEIPGIPAHKFGSNDGWIVLPAEIDAALKIAEQADEELITAAFKVAQAGDDEDLDYWVSTGFPQWLDYLRAALRHGGFFVH